MLILGGSGGWTHLLIGRIYEKIQVLPQHCIFFLSLFFFNGVILPVPLSSLSLEVYKPAT